MARTHRPLPQPIADRLAALAKEMNARRRSYRTDGLSATELIVLFQDIGCDNDRLMKEEETCPLRKQSSWLKTLDKDEKILDLIAIQHWHFLSTRNPVFVFRALDFGQILSSERYESLTWVHDYLAGAAAALLAAVDRPPAGPPGEAIAKALGFSLARNRNPLRQARARMRDDAIYIGVRRLTDLGCKVMAAIGVLAEAGLGSESAVRAAYYRVRDLAKKPFPAAEHLPLLRVTSGVS
jgi:hypothetical protein